MKKTFLEFLEERVLTKEYDLEQLGSNPGGIGEAEDDEGNVVKGYVKYTRGGSEEANDQLKVEIVASRICHLFGLKTTKAQLIDFNGKSALWSNWQTLKTINWSPRTIDSFSEEKKLDLAKHFIVAVLTRNWDVAGLEYDNLVEDTEGNLVLVDSGGSFHFRAQGGIKPKNFGDDLHPDKHQRVSDGFNPHRVEELTSFLTLNQQTKTVFASFFKKNPQLLEAANDVLKEISDSELLGAFRGVTFSDDKIKAILKKNLIARKNIIIQSLEDASE